MPQYSYTAIDTAGNARKGKLTAQDKLVATQLLQAQDLYVVSIDEPGTGLNQEIDLSRLHKYLSVPRRQLIFTCHHQIDSNTREHLIMLFHRFGEGAPIFDIFNHFA